MHYINLRESSQRPYYALIPWARPGYVSLMILPAMLGITAARVWAACFTVALVWQTMKLADDLRLPRATLAGMLLIAQPLVFQFASDTMTEIPMTLGTLVAIRLWLHGRPRASLALVGFLPLVRPEGAFFALAWGLMALATPALGSILRRFAWSLVLGHGMLLWVLACWVLTPQRDPLYFLHTWSWPVDSTPIYGRGSLWHHVRLWPYYTGPVLLGLFLVGLAPAIRHPRMALPLVVFAIVFGVHSILWWQGWMGALGLMRIQACAAFTVALICLFGWNRIADAMRRHWRPLTVRVATAGTWLALLLTPIVYYVLNPEAWYFVNQQRAVAFVKQNDLLGPAPAIFFSDLLAVADADAWQVERNRIHSNPDHVEQRRVMEEVIPVGAVGIWDNQRGEVWHGVSIEQLRSLGYDVLFTARFQPPGQTWLRELVPAMKKRPLVQEVVVLKRTRLPRVYPVR
jgi:hypothetical protein